MSTKQSITCYDPFHNRSGHFGDGWRWCSYLLQFSEQKPDKTIVVDGTPKTKHFLSIMKSLFDSSGDFVFSSNSLVFNPPKDKPNHHRPNWDDFFAHQQLPTKKQWLANKNSKIICYQFDGIAERTLKNSPQKDVNDLIKACTEAGYTPINIGGGRSMDFIIDTIVNSRLFVGVASGMACLSISTGIPICIITNKLCHADINRYHKTWHGNKEIKYLKTTKDFIYELLDVEWWGPLSA